MASGGQPKPLLGGHGCGAVFAAAAGLVLLAAAIRLLGPQWARGSGGTDFSAGWVTVPSREVGERLAEGLVEARLAACVNIIPGVTSVYSWKGKVEKDSELILMLKTRTELVPSVTAYVRKHHPYEVAEVITAVIHQGNAPYLEWLGEHTRP
eukprot:TRINITY_DN9030_c0_g4_i1.p2 TRINITY_DN9030_c0_g4~~TRINITY_DN9030_c0_g4_i1.p2  ORF type:complete len:152 (+),score=54.92 TRINITY_DN9030_c0_g4_i1:60-515(+)